MCKTVLAALVLLSSFVLGGCAITRDGDMMFNHKDCEDRGLGDPDPKHPVVCISVYPGATQSDPGGLLVNPYVVKANRKDNGGGTNKIKWTTRNRRENVDVSFQQTGCVESNAKDCPQGSGECEAPVSQTSPDYTQCAYTIEVTLPGGQTLKLDPIIIIDTD